MYIGSCSLCIVVWSFRFQTTIYKVIISREYIQYDNSKSKIAFEGLKRTRESSFYK